LAEAVSDSAAAGRRALPRRWLPWAAGAALGWLWFAAFHYRFHEGSATGSGAILESRPDLLLLSAPLFLVAFTVGSAAIWMPCIMQMVLVLSGLGSGSGGRFRGRWFFMGYIGTYAALGLAAASLGEAFGRPEVLGALQVVGGGSIAFIGLHILGVFGNRLLKPCGSAVGFALKGGRLHRLGRLSSGVAFAVYCAGCCGPLLYPLFIFAAASGSLFLGTAITAGFALAMAAPIAILAFMGRQAVSRVVSPVANSYALVGRVAGLALLVFGTLLVMTQPLIWLIDTTHQIAGE
jgi:cytochrome c biogenesis protein CcdA